MARSKPRSLYPNGRTFNEAVAAGNYYRLSTPEGEVVMDSPGCGSPEEALRAALKRSYVRSGDTLVLERHLPGSALDFAILETLGTLQVP